MKAHTPNPLREPLLSRATDAGWKIRRPRLPVASGATLSQVLIAVMLIMVMTALLYPALQKARGRTHQGKCLANLRQHGIAVAQRIADTGDIPPYKQWFETGGGAIWRTHLLNYMPVNASMETCPAAKEPYQKNTRFANRSYDTLAANYGWSVGAGRSPFKKVAAIPYPSRVFLLADAGPTAAWAVSAISIYEDLIDPKRATNFSFRHNGRANILFLDGHIEARLPEEIPLYRPRTETSFYFWDED